ncbi:MAG: adenylyl-sulfate kinase, partial [Gemmataceae bacterium]
YRRARAGEVQHLTGIHDPYEPPLTPEVECNTEMETQAESAHKVLKAVLFRLNQGERRGP